VTRVANPFPPIDYSGVGALFERYVSSVQVNLDQRQRDWAQAARSDLQEVDFLSQEIIAMNNALTSREEYPYVQLDPWTIPSTTAGAFWSDRPARKTEQYRQEIRLQVDTKNFYRTAWNLIQALENLPNLQGCGCKPVHEVRNILVDHRDKITRESFQYSDIVGPQIKGPRTDDQASLWPDAGFVPNSQAFVRHLKAALGSATHNGNVPP
jgi:hypothetical protein